jgi:hypothetical protein
MLRYSSSSSRNIQQEWLISGDNWPILRLQVIAVTAFVALEDLPFHPANRRNEHLYTAMSEPLF